MDTTEVMARIKELADAVDPLPAEEAIAAVTSLLGRLDARGATYELEAIVLLRIAATILRLSGA